MKPRTAFMVVVLLGLAIIPIGWIVTHTMPLRERHTPRNQYASRSRELAAEADNIVMGTEDVSADVNWATRLDDEPEDDFLRGMSLYEQAYYYDPSNSHVWMGFGRCYYALAMYRPADAKQFVPQANYWLTRVVKIVSPDHDEAKLWLQLLAKKYPQFASDGTLHPTSTN